MAKKELIYQELDRIPVQVEDTTLTSPNYLKITYITPEFTLGKNIIKFKGNPDVFLDRSRIFVEVLDSNGDPIYHEAKIDRYSTRQEAVITVFITSDVPPGPTTIYVCGTLRRDINGRKLDTTQVNFRWRREVYTDINVPNRDEIIFDELPTIQMSSSLERYVPARITRNITLAYTNLQYIYRNSTPYIISAAGNIFNPNVVNGNVYIPTSGISNTSPITSSTITQTYLTASIKARPSSSIVELLEPLQSTLQNSYGTYVFNSMNIAEATFSYYRETKDSATIDKLVNLTYVLFSKLEPTAGTINKIRTYVQPANTDGYIYIGETYLTGSDGTIPTSSLFTLNLPTLFTSEYVNFKFEFVNPYGDVSRQIVEKKGVFIPAGNTYIEGNNNILTGSLTVSGAINFNGHIRLDPSQDPDLTGTTFTSSTFLFVSASNTALNNDLYFRQNGNVTKLKWFEGMLNTGILYGGTLSYSESVFYVSSGSGIIVNHNATTGSEVAPIVDYVTWSATTRSIAGPDQNTFVYIDNSGQVQTQSYFFTPEQYHNSLPIGRVSHYSPGSTTITGVGNNISTAYDIDGQQNEFVRAFGPLKVSGVDTTAQPASLRIDVSAGTTFNLGGFYQYSPDFPSLYDSSTYATASIIRIYRSGSGYNFDNNAGSYYTTVDPTKWDNGSGVLQNISNNNWSIQRVYVNPITGRAHIYYSQTAPYPTLAVALADLPTEPFVESDVTKNSYVFSAYLVVKSNTTDLANSENRIIAAGLFRGSGGGGGSSAAVSALSGLSDVTLGTLSYGDLLMYDSTYWFNTKTLSGSYILSGSLQTNDGVSVTSLTASFVSASSITGSLLGTSSWANNAITASYILNAVSSSFATSASFASTASYVLNAVSSSFATTSSYALQALSSSFAVSASWAPTGQATIPPSLYLYMFNNFT